MSFKFLFSFLVVLLMVQTVETRGEEVLFRESFKNLENWKPIYFPKIKRHTIYTVETREGERYLKAVSDASASAILYIKEFNVYDFSKVRWRWKVDNIFQKGNAKTKEGDDYPLRIYILFKYDPERASGWEKIQYNTAKLIYGEYPPHSTINYIWASHEHPETIITNSYSNKSKMILIQKGTKNIGKWVEQEVHIIKDYQKAFGGEPPPLASLAVMSDSDNTGENATAYISFIEIFR